MSDDLKTYFVLGHSQDLTKEYGGVLGLDIRPVPEGCIYCTISQPGEVSYLPLIQGLYNFEHDISKRDKLFDPQGNYLDIKEIVESSKDHSIVSFVQIFTVLVNGDTFVNNSSTYMMNFIYITNQNNIRLFKSGLYEISRDHPIPDPNNSMLERVVNPNNISLEDIHFLYDGAIVPNVDNVINILLSRHTASPRGNYTLYQLTDAVEICIREVGVEDQLSLFKKYPGIHYNFGCQTLDRDIDRRRLLERRQYEVGIVRASDPAYAQRLQNEEERIVDPLQRINYGTPRELTPQELRNYKQNQELYSKGIKYGGKSRRASKKSKRASKKSKRASYKNSRASK